MISMYCVNQNWKWSFCSAFSSLCLCRCDKTLGQKQRGRNGFVYLLLQIIIRHPRKSGQELKQKQRQGHGGELFTGLLSAFFLKPPSIICSRVSPPIVAWVLPRQSLMKKMQPQACLQAIWRRPPLCEGSFFPDNSSLCQVNKITGQHTMWYITVLRVPPEGKGQRPVENLSATGVQR